MSATAVHPLEGEDYSHVPTERATGPQWVLQALRHDKPEQRVVVLHRVGCWAADGRLTPANDIEPRSFSGMGGPQHATPATQHAIVKECRVPYREGLGMVLTPHGGLPAPSRRRRSYVRVKRSRAASTQHHDDLCRAAGRWRRQHSGSTAPWPAQRTRSGLRNSSAGRYLVHDPVPSP